MDNITLMRQTGRDEMFKIWHAPEWATFILMQSDGGSVVLSEKAYPIKRGVLCFIGEGRYHYTMPEDPAKYERTKLFVDSKLLSGLLMTIGDGRLEKRFSDGAFVYAELTEDVYGMLLEESERLVKNGCTDEADKALYTSLLLKLVSAATKYSVESVRTSSGAIGKAIEYINANIYDSLTIDGICKRVHLSKYYFCRSFKSATGMSVMEYILKTRIVMAKELLKKDERLSVSEISSRCGFSSLSYFSRVFKEDTGITPLGYRRGKDKN